MNTPTQAGMIEAARVTITREAWDFLCGAGALEGLYFGNPHPERKGRFWWRAAIREAGVEAADDQTTAELATAKAALGEINRIAVACGWANDGGNCGDVADLAAPYAVATDPLVEGRKLGWGTLTTSGGQLDVDALLAELAKRGITIPEAGQ